MLKRSQVLLALTSLLVTVWTMSAFAESKLGTFESSTGEKYFALSLSVDAAPAASATHEVVILFDTSASQTGIYRDDALAALEAMLGSFSARDRIKLVAVDLNAIPLTEGFVAPKSAEMQQALGKLERRAPLGSTDMLGAMQSAVDSFAAKQTNPRSIVYIGDGVSRANAIESKEFESLTSELVKRRAAVSSLAIGPIRNAYLLATLANHTGGMLYIDTDRNTGQESGVAMAGAARGTVLWPVSAKLPAGFREAYPKQMPPLRLDRDSILVGVVQGDGPHDVAVTFEANGRELQKSWRVAGGSSNPDFGFLPQLVEAARPDAGLRLPTVGSAGLREAARLTSDRARQLAELGGHALRTGDFGGARAAADAAIARDPGNPEAVAVRNAVRKYAASGEGEESELRLVNVQDAIGDSDLTREFEGDAGSFLDSVEKAKLVQSEAIQAEVEAGLNETRGKMGSAPESAMQDLKVMLERVGNEPDLDADVKLQLSQRIQAAIRESGRITIEVENRRAYTEENRAAAVEAQRLAEKTARDRQRIRQLMDRFNSLLDEGKYYSAEMDVAAQVEELEPDLPIGRVARWNSRNTKNVKEMIRLRDLRHRNFVDTMYQVEAAAIPFPDEPPVVYPDAAVWEELTLRRAKYASVDLSGKTGSAEGRILRALDDETEFDYLDQPLTDVMDDISFNHNIPIVVDTKALDDFGIDTGTPITRQLKGISLRSALRLMLNELELTYIIKDEVLQITTPEKAESQLITKVYPVGDLVIPIISGGSGQQGGGGGGMMGGGGGGFFAVGDELSLGVEKKTEAPAKAKPTLNSTSKAPRSIPLPIKLDRQPSDSLYEAWDKHFAGHRLDSASKRMEHARQVRETVRRLKAAAQSRLKAEDAPGAKAKLDEVVIVIQAGLRHGQPQPWMYEAMSLAMLASGAPVEEVERGLMSAVDFSRNDEEILHVASFMSRIGLDQRALKLYREIAVNNPMRPEPFVKGLSLAEKMNDEAGLQWACVGILSQAWETEHRAIEQRARRQAQALLDQMEQEKRKSERAEFLARLDEAVIRDCVVQVTWTGDADVDLLVEEPSATVCSLRNPRTTAGGVMLGDSYSHSGGQSLDGYSELYVCPQGFSGQYRLLLRNVWGKVTAGKVTVEIWTNYGTEKQTYGKQQIPLGEKDAVVNFDIKAGRRVEPLAEEKIATIDRGRLEVGQAILAQQLRALDDTSSLRDYALSLRRGLRDGRIDPRRFGRRGAVGFRPVITPFPEGNQLQAMAVIDASRRFVRFTLFPTPVASGITNVDTFNFASGGGQQGGGGGRGVGGFGGGGI